jgi:hypothetical protein
LPVASPLPPVVVSSIVERSLLMCLSYPRLSMRHPRL